MKNEYERMDNPYKVGKAFSFTLYERGRDAENKLLGLPTRVLLRSNSETV